MAAIIVGLRAKSRQRFVQSAEGDPRRYHESAQNISEYNHSSYDVLLDTERTLRIGKSA